MGMHKIAKMPSPEELKEEMPLLLVPLEKAF